jgi:hypothetical protein
MALTGWQYEAAWAGAQRPSRANKQKEPSSQLGPPLSLARIDWQRKRIPALPSECFQKAKIISIKRKANPHFRYSSTD